MTDKINYTAVIVCVIMLHALGFLWYSPVLFAEPWMEMVGWTEEKMQASPPSAAIWVVNFLTSALSVYVLAWLLTRLNVTNGLRGAGVGLGLAIAFNFMPVLNSSLFAGDPTGLVWITAGFTVVGMTISGFILGAWAKKAKVVH